MRQKINEHRGKKGRHTTRRRHKLVNQGGKKTLIKQKREQQKWKINDKQTILFACKGGRRESTNGNEKRRAGECESANVEMGKVRIHLLNVKNPIDSIWFDSLRFYSIVWLLVQPEARDAITRCISLMICCHCCCCCCCCSARHISINLQIPLLPLLFLLAFR